MNIKLHIYVFLLTIISLTTIGHAERTKDQMYDHFNGRYSCFRRLNATHQTGCSSKRDGSTGIVHFVEKKSDLYFILKNGSAGNYIPVIPTALLTVDVVAALKSSEIIAGLVVYNDTSTALESYSHEHVCPNARFNQPGTCSKPWNRNGTGILHWDFHFPIYYVNNDEDRDKIKECFNKFNNFSYETQYERSLCSLELDAFMYATTDTPTCRRRSNSRMNMNPVKFCDPLGGDNVWASLFPIKNGTSTNVIVAARLDTTSLFHGMFPGAVNPVTGLVTLLATADLLKRMVGTTETDKNVLFLLFNGETYDYIGSQRIVYDMERGEFPSPASRNAVPAVRLEDVALYVELGELTRTDVLHAYVNTDGTNSAAVRFYRTLAKNSPKPLKQGDVPPPSSLQSFLRAKPRLEALVLADHGDSFINKFYNSIYDNFTNIGFNGSDWDDDSIQLFTANVSSALASTLYEEITAKPYGGSEKPNLKLIHELYNCYLLDPDCKVHQAVQRKKLRETPYNSYSFYVGVNAAPNLLTYAIGLTLGWLTGDVVPSVNKSCTDDSKYPMYQYFEFSKSLDDINATVCYRVTMNFTEAVSPAFLEPDYDWKSGKYSSWSESTWKDLTVRMFLKPSAAHERFTIALGSVTLIMSLILVYFVKSRSHVLFVTPENCSPTSC